MSPIIFNKLKPPIDLAACGILKIKCIYKLKLALLSRSWLSQLAIAPIMTKTSTWNSCCLAFSVGEELRNYRWNLQYIFRHKGDLCRLRRNWAKSGGWCLKRQRLGITLKRGPLLGQSLYLRRLSSVEQQLHWCCRWGWGSEEGDSLMGYLFLHYL